MVSVVYTSDRRIQSAMNGVDEILQYEFAPCFVVTSINYTISIENSINSTYLPLFQLEHCMELCCDYVVLILHSLKKTTSTLNSMSKFRMYIIVDLVTSENPYKSQMLLQDNAVIFQAVKNSNLMFGIYEKKQGKFKLTNVWNGKIFINEPFMRNFKGETMRVASAMLPPYAEVYTYNDKVYAGGGTETIFFKALSDFDNINIEWIDISQKERGSLWGTLFLNGTATGLLRYILEYKTDMTSLANYCGYYQHRLIQCSIMHDFDGLVAVLQRPKPRPTWQGLLTPYQKWAWMSIAATLIVTTLILGICQRLTLNTKKNDWPLHFLDALHPMTGRPMGLPGFNAAHLGKDRKILAFEIFLVVYSMACLVINTGYEGNLKSHLAATVYPTAVKTLKDFTQQPFKDIIYLIAEEEGLIQVLRDSPILEMASLPDRKLIRGRDMNLDLVSTFLEPLKGHTVIATRIPTMYQIKRFLTRRDGTQVIQIVPELITGYPITIFLTRMNRFSPHINNRLSQWMEGGFFVIHMKWELENVQSIPFDDEVSGNLL